MDLQPVKPGSAAPAEGCIDYLADAIVYAPIPFAVLDLSGRITCCNQALCDLTGYTYGELKQAGLLANMIPPKWQGAVVKAMEARSMGCCAGKLEIELLRKDGRCLPTGMILNFAGGTGEKPPFYFLFFSDLTEHKLVEAALNKRESGMARALHIAHIGTWDVDLSTKIFICSDVVLRMIGAGPEHGVMKCRKILESYVYPDDAASITRDFKEMMAGCGTIHSTFRIVRRDGSVRNVNVEGEIIPGPDGKPARLFGTIQDITERKHAEDELKAAKAQSELYVDLMGHDINNMNQIAMGYLELAEGIIEAHGSLGMEDRFLITRPIDTLRENSRLIDHVRKIQKSKAGVYKSEEIEIEGMLRDVIARFSDIKGREVKISLVSSCACTVMANELLREVFLNLVGNAIKHSTGPLAVNITAEKCEVDGSTVCRVTVEDNGPGIPDDLRKKLFDRLSLEKTRASGKGFGLCLTKMLVDDFNGRFWVEDRVAGDHLQGCRFVVLLPTVEK